MINIYTRGDVVSKRGRGRNGEERGGEERGGGAGQVRQRACQERGCGGTASHLARHRPGSRVVCGVTIASRALRRRLQASMSLNYWSLSIIKGHFRLLMTFAYKAYNANAHLYQLSSSGIKKKSKYIVHY